MIQDGEELVFLYNLVDGYASSSYAGHIARLAGIPDTLVKRGAEVRQLQQQQKIPNQLQAIYSHFLF